MTKSIQKKKKGQCDPSEMGEVESERHEVVDRDSPDPLVF